MNFRTTSKRKSSKITPLASKKRRKPGSATEEVTFDFSAREEYLTGFHKRKLQRIKHAKEEAIKKERAERIVARKNLRDERKSDLEKRVQAVNSAFRDMNGMVDENEAEPDEIDQSQSHGVTEPMKVDHEEEYVDEDRLTTVTVEAVEVSRDGLHRIVDEDEQVLHKINAPKIDDASSTIGKEKTKNGKRICTKERPGEKRKKKKKFKYESKAERKVTRYKERSGNKAKAKSRRE